MKINKHKILALLVCTSMLMSCGANTGNETNSAANESGGDTGVELNIKPMSESIVEYEDNDFYTDWENENPGYIKMNGTSAELEGTGAAAENNIITVNSPGTYVVSGKLEDGQIIVDSDGEGAVRLVLNGAEINCSDNAPIYVKSAGKAIISLADGTENTIADGSTYVLADAASDEPNAAIFSKDDLTINGPGALSVSANYNNGIFGKDDLKVTGGNITINSADDGLLGRDLLAVRDSNITVNSEGDGIRATNDTDEGKGNIVLENGSYTITSGAKGIEAESAITIIDGKYTINSTDDSVHSNGTIAVSGGTVNIASEDDGIHADSEIDISGGTIDILKSYEGLESAVINISDGIIKAAASDDGINISGGNDSSSVNGRPGQNSFASSGSDSLNISGGSICIDANGDGIDANGSVYMSGGTVIVNGPTSQGNGALDYYQKFEISGGLLIAAGSAGMAQTPSEGSAQNSVLISYSKVQKAGTIVSIEGEDGKNIITFAPGKDYQSIIVSSPEFKTDSAYQLYTGGSSTGTENNGLYAEGSYENGTKLTDFTVSKTVLSISESGEEVTGGASMPGQGGPGGKGGGMRTDGNTPNGERPEMPEGTPPGPGGGTSENPQNEEN